MEKNNSAYSNCKIFALPCNTSGCVKNYNNYFLFMVSIYIDKEIGHRAGRGHLLDRRVLVCCLINSLVTVSDPPICSSTGMKSSLGANIGTNLSVVCRVTAHPPPTKYRWTFNNSRESFTLPDNR